MVILLKMERPECEKLSHLTLFKVLVLLCLTAALLRLFRG